MPFETTAISILALFEDNSDVGLKLKIAITMDMARAQRFLDLGNLAVRSISLGIYIWIFRCLYCPLIILFKLFYLDIEIYAV